MAIICDACSEKVPAHDEGKITIFPRQLSAEYAGPVALDFCPACYRRLIEALQALGVKIDAGKILERALDALDDNPSTGALTQEDLVALGLKE